MTNYTTKSIPLILLVGGLWIVFIGCEKAVAPVLSPEQAIGSFQVASDLDIQLVASEPMVQDPVSITFDEDGRLWVVEMLGFMQDIDGSDETAPIGRISVLTDEDDDGRMDKSVVFLDSLVLPRAIAVVDGGALVAENIPLWYVEDLDGDLRADRKTLIDETYGGRGLPEHSANGLWRGMDNWYYNAKSTYRYRKINGKWIKDTTEFRGQWGLSHDNIGRLYYNYNWSQLHADLVPPNYLLRNPHHIPTSGIDHGLTLNRKIYPISNNTAVNRGYVPGTLTENGRLLEFASACAPLIYRGDGLPGEFSGNAFVCEPTGNLIKRNQVNENGFLLSATEAYQNKEFLASTDERFRPINMANGPDGALYIVDMYKGVIQHAPYMTPYLREETLKRGLDKPINMGRIWRIVPKNSEKLPKLRLSALNSEELVSFLAHENGWYRDMAQRLLVERREKKVITDLIEIVRSGENPLAKIHAIWTLEGLQHREPAVFLAAVQDADPRVQAAAMRVIEPIAESNAALKGKLASLMTDNWKKADPFAQLQIALTAGILPKNEAIPLLDQIITEHYNSPVMRDVVMSSLKDRELLMLQRLWQNPAWQDLDAGKEIFQEILAAAIVKKGEVEEVMTLFQELAVVATDASLTRRGKAILSGLTVHANRPDSLRLALPKKTAFLETIDHFSAPVQAQIAKLPTIFKWPGQARAVAASQTLAPEQVADPGVIALGRQTYLNTCSGCHGTDGAGMKRFAPPLINSEWVLGDEKKLALILLHGMEGPLEVSGVQYDTPDILPVMPSFSVVDDKHLAAVMTYIRQEWGHAAPLVKSSRVTHIRFRSQGKITPWTVEELLEVGEGDME